MKNKLLIYGSVSLVILSTLSLGTHPAFLFLAIGILSSIYRKTMKLTNYVKRRVLS